MNDLEGMTREQLHAEVLRLRACLGAGGPGAAGEGVALGVRAGDERQVRLIAESQTEMIACFDAEYRILSVSPSLLRTFKLSEEDALGKPFLPFVHPDDHGAVLASLEALRQPPHESRNEARQQTPSGSRWFEWHNRALVDDSGRVVGIVGVGRDVTDRHNAVEALRESEERYRELIRNVPIGVFRTSLGPEGRYLTANPALAALYGYESVEALMDRRVADAYVNPEDRARWANKVLSAGTVEGEEVLLRRRDGSTFWASVSAKVVRDADGVPQLYDGTLREITRRKAYEAAIARRDAILEAIAFAAERFLERGPWQNEMNAVLARLGTAAECDRVYLFEVDSRTDNETRVSQRFEWTREGIVPQIANAGLQDMPLRATGFGRWCDMMRGGLAVRGDVMSFPLSERRPLALQDIKALLAVPIFVERVWWGLIGFDSCCSPRRWTDLDEDALKTAARAIGAAIARTRTEDRRRQLELVIEQSDEAVFTADVDGFVEYVNPAFTRVMGFAAEEVLGKRPHFFGAGDDNQGFPKDFLRVLRTNGVWRGRMSHRRKDGSVITAEGTASLIRDENGAPFKYVAVQRDVTVQDQLEAQLQHARKMEALGTLAGGIAHDFRNILSSVAGWLELASGELEPGSAPRRHLDRAARACGRASDLVKQILTFSRKEQRVQAPIGMTPVVRESLRMLRSAQPTNVLIDDALEEVEAYVSAASTDMQQIVINLGSNAFHAMPEGGTLTVGLRELCFGPGEGPENIALTPGRYVLLSVEDTGHGMDQETQRHMFDPFFTTKVRGEGTGLGLATVHGIVRGLGGAIDVVSAPGKGSIFRVYLPVCSVPDAGRSQATESRSESIRGKEVVMLVDDDDALVEMMRIGLGALGYTVEVFTDPSRALESFASAPRTYDVLVTDHIMPGMSGLHLVQRVREARPQLPVVLVSGYAEGFSPEWLRSHDIGRLVVKPTGSRNVARAIRAVMENQVEASIPGLRGHEH